MMTYPPQITVDDRTPATEQVFFVVVCLLAGIALAFATGAVWAAVADPPRGLVTDQGVFLTGEIDYDQQVAMTLWFLVVGAALGVVSGFLVVVLGRRHGTTAVIAVILLAVVASLLGAWSGIHLFGPDSAAQLAEADPGDFITSKLAISSKVAYLGWPIGGLVGAVIGIALWRGDPKPPPMPGLSSTLDGHQSTTWG